MEPPSPPALLARYCMNSATDSPPGWASGRSGGLATAEITQREGLARMLGFARRVNAEVEPNWRRRERRTTSEVCGKVIPRTVPGIDDYFLVMCFDDWEAEGRKIVEATLARDLHGQEEGGRAAKL